jgi:hypothetical protein
MYCQRHGHLTPFSEQYMIDCGKHLVDGLDGCTSGSPDGVVRFVHNFGVELLHNYPYVARESECLYDEDTKLKTTGYIRFDHDVSTFFELKYWPEMLELGNPLLVIYAAGAGFLPYAGGVYDGRDCVPRAPRRPRVLAVEELARPRLGRRWVLQVGQVSGWTVHCSPIWPLV